MSSSTHWNLLFANHQSPCIVADVESDEILYLNAAMRNLLGDQVEALGRKFYQVISNDTAADNQKTALEWAQESYIEHKFYCKSLNRGFQVTHTKVEYQGESYHFAKYEPTENMANLDFKFEEAMTTCVKILQKPQEQIIPAFMELLCEFYGCHSAFINRVNLEKKEMVCEIELCSNPAFQESIDFLVTENNDLLFDWMEEKNELNIIEADIHRANENPLSLKVLELFQMENITVHLMEDKEGKINGVVGLNNRTKGFLDYRLLKTVTTFVTEGLIKASMVETLEQVKNTDNLTGFASRNSYSLKVEELTKTPPQSVGVVFVNINGLKEINENLGYNQGDRHIKNSAELVKNHFPYRFYRLSGDEFVGIASNISKEELEEKVLSLQKKMKEEEDYRFALGYAWGKGNYDFAALVREADTVMYINKQEYYHSSNRHFTNVGDSTLSDLLSYLANDEFMVYLQPQVWLKDGSVYGAEALIRRYDKTNEKMVFPDQFIPLYEKKSVIRHVDIFVVEQVCKLLAQWLKQGKRLPISVNLSRVTLLEHGIVETIVKICDQYEVPHQLLVIEVTERVGLIENNVASTLITSFKKHGFHISLDDFGCAYSNIVTLAQIEVDEVKIDKSLVDDVTTNKKNYILVKNVLVMCHELEGTTTLAEGIETQEQGELLYSLGCELGQGYFYSRPIPIKEFCEKYVP